MDAIRVLVAGGRDYANYARVAVELDELVNRIGKPVTVIHGGARGADTLAGRWAQEHGYACEVYRADWEAHGKAAGPLRNQRMIDEGKPNFMVAFPGGRGTADMVRRAVAAGLKVHHLSKEEGDGDGEASAPQQR